MFDLATFATLLPQIASMVSEDSSIPNPHLFRKSYATGGVVAEGGEVVQQPGMKAETLEGPSHAQGGIDLDLPGGTVIYSDKVKGPDGRTMAERKESRDRMMEKLGNALKANKADVLHKAAAQRGFETMVLEEMSDIMVMQQEFLKTQQAGQKVKAETGYVVPPGQSSTFYGESPANQRKIYSGYKWDQPFDPYYFQKAYFKDKPTEWDNAVGPNTTTAMGTPEGQKLLASLGQEYNTLMTPSQEAVPSAQGNFLSAARDQEAAQVAPSVEESPYTVDFGMTQLSTAPPNSVRPGEYSPADARFVDTEFTYSNFRPPLLTGEEGPDPNQQSPSTADAAGSTGGVTAGDIAAIAGPIGKTFTTLFNRLGDRPTPNYYAGYGAQEQAMANQSIRGAAEGRDVEMMRNNALINSLRRNNGARSINTSRAYDIATLTEGSRNASRISSTYNRVLSDLMARRGALSSQQDRMVAEGQKFADVTDTQNRDAFATNIGKNIGDIATGVQSRERNQLRRKLGITNQSSQGIEQLMELLSQLLS